MNATKTIKDITKAKEALKQAILASAPQGKARPVLIDALDALNTLEIETLKQEEN